MPYVNNAILKKYKKGGILTEDKQAIEPLLALGYLHVGTHVEINDENETTTLSSTAKTTRSGLRHLKFDKQFARAEKPLLRGWLKKAFDGLRL